MSQQEQEQVFEVDSRDLEDVTDLERRPQWFADWQEREFVPFVAEVRAVNGKVVTQAKWLVAAKYIGTGAGAFAIATWPELAAKFKPILESLLSLAQ